MCVVLLLRTSWALRLLGPIRLRLVVEASVCGVLVVGLGGGCRSSLLKVMRKWGVMLVSVWCSLCRVLN